MNKTAPSVASIPISVGSVFVYILFIGVGYTAGMTALVLLSKRVGAVEWFFVANLIVYSGAVFAHFRFAHGLESWPKLEFAELGRTILWAALTVIVGYVIIAYVGGIWDRNLQGFDDAWHLRPEVNIQRMTRHIDRFTASLITGIDICIIAPVAEEIVFRSGLYRILKGRMTISSAAGISALVFAVSHRSVAAFLPIWVLGFICCWLYEKTADIRGPIVFHAGYNLLVFFASRP